ncbi:MAG: flagellar biosynthesis regulator FlaF [Paracoccus sp. (in: a-proteobacteria)]|nr:flagellar biosynthesis regulator FlaF [Paracoccus sp. (in: a-proteobacteria)]
MLASNIAHAGRYGSPLSKAPREIEYELFARVTRALQSVAVNDKGGSAAKAVVDNTQLWTELAADLSHEGNALPAEVKGNLLSLAMYSIRHGNRVLTGSGDVASLIEINLNIMKGLRGRGGE